MEWPKPFWIPKDTETQRKLDFGRWWNEFNRRREAFHAGFRKVTPWAERIEQQPIPRWLASVQMRGGEPTYGGLMETAMMTPMVGEIPPVGGLAKGFKALKWPKIKPTVFTKEQEKFFTRYYPVVKRIHLAEKRTPIPPELMKIRGWRQFSKARGYTKKEIDDFALSLKMQKEGKKLGLTIDDLNAVDFEVAQSLKATTLQRPPLVEKVLKASRFSRKAVIETEELRKPERITRISKAMEELETAKTAKVGFIKARGALKGKYPKAKLELPDELKITTEEVDDLLEYIRKSDAVQPFDKIRLDVAFKKLLLGDSLQNNEIRLIEKYFGKEFAGIFPKGGKFLDEVLSAMNLPRAILASFDLSAPLRQGAVLFFGHPIKGVKAMWPMVKAFAREKWADDAMGAIADSKYFKLGQEHKLPILNWKAGARLTQREESFMTRFAHYIPGVKHSERAFLVYLNKLRQDVFDSLAPRLMEHGAKPQAFRELTDFIANATGRGVIPRSMQGSVPMLNTLFFSPRLQVSRIMLAKSMFSSNPIVRKEAIRSIVSFLGVNASIVTLLKMSGMAEIETNPRSSDFMKIKVGETRLDPWAGFQQYTRLMVRLITGETKVGRTGAIKEIDRLQEVYRFGRTKFSPIVGLATDILAGEDFIGREMTFRREDIQEQARQRLVPLFIQDMWEAMQIEGFPMGMVAAPGVLGVGVITYKQRPRVGRAGSKSRLKQYRDIIQGRRKTTKKKERTLEDYRKLIKQYRSK